VDSAPKRLSAREVLAEARAIASATRDAMEALRDREAEVLERLGVYLAQVLERLERLERELGIDPPGDAIDDRPAEQQLAKAETAPRDDALARLDAAEALLDPPLGRAATAAPAGEATESFADAPIDVDRLLAHATRKGERELHGFLRALVGLEMGDHGVWPELLHVAGDHLLPVEIDNREAFDESPATSSTATT